MTANTCDYCGGVFATLKELLIHRQTHMPQQQPPIVPKELIEDEDIKLKEKKVAMARLDNELRKYEAGAGSSNAFEKLLEMQQNNHIQLMSMMDKQHAQSLEQLKQQHELQLKIAQLELGLDEQPNILNTLLDNIDKIPMLLNMIGVKGIPPQITTGQPPVAPVAQTPPSPAVMPLQDNNAPSLAKVEDFQQKIRNGTYSPAQAYEVLKQDSPEIASKLTVEDFKQLYQMVATGTTDLVAFAKMQGLK